MVAGWPFDEFRQATGHDLRKEWPAEMKRLVQQGWAQLKRIDFNLLPKGCALPILLPNFFLR